MVLFFVCFVFSMFFCFIWGLFCFTIMSLVFGLFNGMFDRLSPGLNKQNVFSLVFDNF